MRVVCAWCQAVLKEGDGPSEEPSHGICDDCLAELKKEGEEYIARVTEKNNDQSQHHI